MIYSLFEVKESVKYLIMLSKAMYVVMNLLIMEILTFS